MNFKEIEKYYETRGLTMPEAKEALDFAITEIGEAMDAWIRTNQEGWVRNNPDKDANFGWELADCYQMLEVAARKSTGKSLNELLLEKWKSKGVPAKHPLEEIPFLVIDAESVGLFGGPFAVAGCEVHNGIITGEFDFGCEPRREWGSEANFDWVQKNVHFTKTHTHPQDVIEAFWGVWLEFKSRNPKGIMVAECLWPVEAHLMSITASSDPRREFEGPYPLHDISSIMLCAGMDPMKEYERLVSEKPKHHPLMDARQSARLLWKAIQKIKHND